MSPGRCDGMFAPTNPRKWRNNYVWPFMCDAVTAPNGQATLGSRQNKPHVYCQQAYQDFAFAKPRQYHKLDCGRSRHKIPGKLWRMLQVYRKNDQVYRNSYGSCSLLKTTIQLPCASWFSKRVKILQYACCTATWHGYPILQCPLWGGTASLHIIEWS